MRLSNTSYFEVKINRQRFIFEIDFFAHCIHEHIRSFERIESSGKWLTYAMLHSCRLMRVVFALC